MTDSLERLRLELAEARATGDVVSAAALVRTLDRLTDTLETREA